MQVPAAEIITIGDELLYGQVIDTNSAFLGEELGKIGFRVMQITSVSDSPGHIRRAIDEALQRADLVLITGGLGPTKDDLTKNVLADYFGVILVMDEDVLQDVKDRVARRGRELNELNRQQALVPRGCTPLRNAAGTAPGMWFEVGGKVLVSMPGVPFEMKKMMHRTVLPKLKAHFPLPAIRHKLINTVGIAESSLAEKLEDWENSLPEVLKLAYLPSLGGVRLRLTGFDDGSGKLDDVMEQHLRLLQKTIPEYIFGYDDTTLEREVGQMLAARQLTISTAESCTGGYVAHRFSTVIGASAYFQGGIVAYQNEVKHEDLGVLKKTLEKYTAVSEETVKEMAEGIRKRMKTDIGISTTGIAGPGGAEPEKPIGTIWIGYADAEKTIARKLMLTEDREINIQLTSTFLLDLVRQSLPALNEQKS